MLGPEEPESRTASRARLDPRPTAAPFDDLSDQSEADAGALDLVARRERLKDSPDPVLVLGGDPRAVVAYREFVGVARLAPGDADACIRPVGAGVLDGVA